MKKRQKGWKYKISDPAEDFNWQKWGCSHCKNFPWQGGVSIRKVEDNEEKVEETVMID